MIAAVQLPVAIYGGFFGAGIGILMLAGAALAGAGNVHRMNAWKNFGAVVINAAAALGFAASGRVDWPVAAVMALGAIAGGQLGARLALRIGPGPVRRFVIAVGLIMTVATALR